MNLQDPLGDLGYRTHLKPYVARLLSAIGLDVVYQRAEGDWLYVRDETGKEQAVLDMVGGFGAGLLGHNHPELVAGAQAGVDGTTPLSGASQCPRRCWCIGATAGDDCRSRHWASLCGHAGQPWCRSGGSCTQTCRNAPARNASTIFWKAKHAACAPSGWHSSEGRLTIHRPLFRASRRPTGRGRD